MGKTPLDAIYGHPIIEAMNPHAQDYTAVRWLTSSLNPYWLDINIGAGIAFLNLSSSLKMVTAFGMMADDYQEGRYEGVTTLVVRSRNDDIASAVAVLSPAFGIEQVQRVVPGKESGCLSLGLPQARLFDQYSHPANPRIHEECTGPRLLRAAGAIGMVVVSLDSGGTAIGISRCLKSVAPDTIVLGVRPKNGQWVPGAQNAEQMRESGTLSFWKEIEDPLIEVGFKESLSAARRLSREVYPQPGLCSGMAYAGMMHFLGTNSEARDVLHGRNVIFVCPDEGRFSSNLAQAALLPAS